MNLKLMARYRRRTVAYIAAKANANSSTGTQHLITQNRGRVIAWSQVQILRPTKFFGRPTSTSLRNRRATTSDFHSRDLRVTSSRPRLDRA